MQVVAQVVQLGEHLFGRDCHHGAHCLWCHTPTPSKTIKRALYEHPDPAYLHASARAQESVRKYLLVDLARHETDAYRISVRQRSELSRKYAFETDVELSPAAVTFTECTMNRALGWLLREPTRTAVISFVNGTPPNEFWKSLQHAEGAQIGSQQALWIFGVKAPQLPFRYELTRGVHCCHVASDDYKSNLLVFSEPMPTFHRTLMEPGHATPDQLLKRHGGCFSSNRSLIPENLFFGFEVFKQYLEGPIQAEPILPLHQTGHPTATGGLANQTSDAVPTLLQETL